MDANNQADRLLADLTEPQRDAVTHVDGPLLVLAGPGSGKTRVITRRAAYLAATVASPRNILAITFTNKAAAEMRDRIAALGVADGMTTCTFHALCAKLLRIHHEKAYIDRNFTIYDRDDRRKVLKEAIELAGYSSANWTPAAVEKHIGNAKNAMLTPEEYLEQGGDFQVRTVAKIYLAYENLMHSLAALDFDDLLMRTALLLDRDAELRARLEDQFRYVLVDEYQDTNEAQYRIARWLTRERENICATGDPDQSIYGWRGANIENILSFERDYSQARVVRLEQNYRSCGSILEAADAVISHNETRKQKSLWTDNEHGDSVRVIECEDSSQEAQMIAEDIQRQMDDGVAPSEIALFYRTNAMSRQIEEAMLRAGIRYQIARGLEFYSRKEIKDVLAYLRVLVNPADDVALRRIINTPTRGIGAKSVERLFELAESQDRRAMEIILGDDDLSSLGRSAKKVVEFRKLMKSLAEVVELPPSEAIERVLSESGLMASMQSSGDDENAPLANVEELVNAASEFQRTVEGLTLLDWLEHAALVSDVDSVDDQREMVTLMTLHAAKGLEFPFVYIIGLEDGVLPHRRDYEDDPDSVDVEEERRLCFVGMTRAMEKLTLSFARYRMRMGQSIRAARSQFLEELPSEKIEWQRWGNSGSRSSRRAEEGRLPHDIDQWEVGCLVRNPLHGLGRVMAFERTMRNTKVDVLFEDGHRASLFLGYAALERVDYDDVGDY